MNKILDNEYYDLIISNTLVPGFDTGDNITVLNDEYSMMHIWKNNMDACDLGRYTYDNFPSLFTLTSKVSIEKSGITNVRRHPDLSLMGLGVAIGIIDTGIDYQHPAFRNHDGTTRILSIWDQTEQSGMPPKDFNFGSEYGKNHINAALKSTDPLSIVPTFDSNGHGTAIASVIAGTPDEEHSFTGVAPQTELIVVKLKEAKQNLKKLFFAPENALCYQESDLILGIRYILSVSEKTALPLVICIAMGSSQGGHDGLGVISAYLDQIVQLPKTNVSVAAGNEGYHRRHYFHRLEAAPFCSGFNLKIGRNDKKFTMEIWPFPPGKVTIEIFSPNREIVQSISPSAGVCQKFSLPFGQTTIWINNILLEGSTGDQVILVRFDNPIPGIWYFQLTSTENEPFSFHSWLPSGNLISNETYFYHSDPNTTITAPGNTRNALTVTAYNQFDDSILAESGRGYSRFGEIVPDIAAPGYRIPCAIPGKQYGSITGSGAAAAHAAGASAMVMEWGYCKGNHTTVTGLQINHMIMRGAQRNGAFTYPNNIWGYGQIDVYKLFQRISVI
ncbi:MAG TPA: peptidase S8 [Lachnoclostridium sp.]|uniref:S8 family peptidase n=1 Tax=Lacrimispora sp. TaxID=2719234 RepID=UPI000EBB259F|nr:S8 family peptidase [Lacrimispora sp.]HCD46847.1 peptidase S8 [Lachnoclostridium sp.]